MKNHTHRKKLSMKLLVGQCLLDVHLIKKKIIYYWYIVINYYYRAKDCIEKLCKKIKKCTIKVIDNEEKEMIPLTKKENESYKEQNKCHICEEKFCTDKDDENYKNKR